MEWNGMKVRTFFKVNREERRKKKLLKKKRLYYLKRIALGDKKDGCKFLFRKPSKFKSIILLIF